MPLGSKHKSVVIWNGIIETAEKRLAKWKAQYLSLGGRLTLINSVLDSLPTYVMSLFPIPCKVVRKLDKLRRDFLWMGNKEGRGYHLVNWKTSQLSRQEGGMGIRDLKRHNTSLLMKWLWRYNIEDQALWREVIHCKYGQTTHWCTDSVNIPYNVSVWRSIRALWPHLLKNCSFKVGNGSRIMFWEDDWTNQGSLKVTYPELYSVCCNPEATVEDNWSNHGWNLICRRNLEDWEIERVAGLLKDIKPIDPDSLVWKHDRDGVFSVSRLYKRGFNDQNENRLKYWGSLWKNLAPSKVKCFSWLVVRRACLTHEVLQRRGFHMVFRCFLCQEAEETNNHLFLHCKVTTQIWSIFLNLIEVKWSMPEHTSDLMSCWIRRGGSKRQKKCWKTIPSCILWSVWRERNSRCFEDRFNSIQKVKWNCIISFYFWCKENCVEDAEQIIDLLGSL